MQIRNVSQITRRLRLLPPSSQFFHCSQPAFPTNTGLVAPGMHVKVVIRFTPDSLATVSDVIVIDTDQHSVHLPLQASRPRSAINLPAELDFGSVFVNTCATMVINVGAQAGSNSFRFVTSLQGVGTAAAAITSRAFLLGNAFTIEPAEFHLSPSHNETLTTTFAPIEPGTLTVCTKCSRILQGTRRLALPQLR
jgi:hypothetical protein